MEEEYVCPKCKSEDTYMDYEMVYDNSYAVRKCEQCDCSYKIKYRVKPISIEIIE